MFWSFGDDNTDTLEFENMLERPLSFPHYLLTNKWLFYLWPQLLAELAIEHSFVSETSRSSKCQVSFIYAKKLKFDQPKQAEGMTKHIILRQHIKLQSNEAWLSLASCTMLNGL